MDENIDKIIKKLKYFRKKSYTLGNDNRIILLKKFAEYMLTQEQEFDDRSCDLTLKEYTLAILNELIKILRNKQQRVIISKKRARQLTQREQEVLECVTQNYNYPQIMNKLGISKSRLKDCIENICYKFDIWDNVGIRELRRYLN